MPNQHLRTRLCFLAALLVATALGLAYAGSALADRLEARDLAYEAMDVYNEDGFHVREEIMIGKLETGESYYFDTQLSAGNEYFFYVSGDDNVHAIQLRVYDENWDLVAANIMNEPQAEAIYPAEWSGIYHVKVSMVEAEPRGGYWFIISGFK